ncbi:RING-H2 finger protein ATL80 [Dendrobium catenatum]|uniref:RING-type E3 ubiquitin transferase n=1 Tax=Dendrobium catenatum TaxID=906689 RepID=A0A2I0VSK7_9ASPA|nr:RING-H2 finger protein ATL80 [Dendrobium catenatum]
MEEGVERLLEVGYSREVRYSDGEGLQLDGRKNLEEEEAKASFHRHFNKERGYLREAMDGRLHSKLLADCVDLCRIWAAAAFNGVSFTSSIYDNLEYKKLINWIIVTIIIILIVIDMGWCDWLRRQLISMCGMLNRGYDINVIQAEPEVEEDEGETMQECTICLSPFDGEEEVHQLPTYGHSFHAMCIVIWLSSHNNCPICRGIVLPTML